MRKKIHAFILGSSSILRWCHSKVNIRTKFSKLRALLKFIIIQNHAKLEHSPEPENIFTPSLRTNICSV